MLPERRMTSLLFGLLLSALVRVDCASSCTGTPESCAVLADSATCAAAAPRGCSWSEVGSCSGTPTQCGCATSYTPDCPSYASSQSCGDNDCAWRGAGTVCDGAA